MNRAMRRKLDRQARKKFTPEQFKEFASDTTEKYVKEEIDKMSAKVIEDVVEILPIVLRDNRISEQRVSKILTDFSIAFKGKYKEVFADERLSEQRAKESACNDNGSCTAN